MPLSYWTKSNPTCSDASVSQLLPMYVTSSLSNAGQLAGVRSLLSERGVDKASAKRHALQLLKTG